MSFTHRTPLLFALSVMPVLVLGCGKKPADDDLTAERKRDLGSIYAIYEQYSKEHEGRPPTQLSDLTLREYEMIEPVGVRVLKNGDYVFLFGVSAKGSGTVLAYEKNAPTQGGIVLMANGKFENLSADELKSKLK